MCVGELRLWHLGKIGRKRFFPRQGGLFSVAVIPTRFGTGENRTQYEREWHDCGTGRSKRPTERRDRLKMSLYRVENEP